MQNKQYGTITVFDVLEFPFLFQFLLHAK
jgi:hypothetical protein